jgi:hypothetical protein
MCISVNRMESILAKHGIKRDPKALQRAYRLSVGQKMMAEVRDNEGRREILAARTKNGMEYIVIDACHDQVLLARLQHRLRDFIAGLERSSGKVRDRQNVLAGFRRRLFRWKGEKQ